MERELKIAELANIWSVSVPTTWNRIKKHSLTTFKKKDENNKEVNYVRISEENIKMYIVNVNNNDKNVYYEDMLNVDNDDNNVIDAEYTRQEAIKAPAVFDSFINGLKTVYDDCNKRIEKVNEELITYKSQALLLEEKNNREGLYIKEINELKTDNENNNKRYNRLLITLITVIILAIVIIAALGIAVAFYYNKPPKVIETEKVIEKVVEKPVIQNKRVPKRF